MKGEIKTKMGNRLMITNEGVKIDGILIKEKIFNQEMVNWKIFHVD